MIIPITELRTDQGQGAFDLMTTLRNVEISAIDVCNRECSFCPRSDDNYKNKKVQASLPMIEKIALDLHECRFTGRVSFVGFGEPLLYKNLCKAITIIKKFSPSVKWIEVISNGDYLTETRISDLEDAGCTNIIISMYDYDISEKLTKMFEKSNMTLTIKDCFNGFSVVNRKDIMNKTDLLNINRPCYLPFYKMIIDSDGDAILCSNDWKRQGKVGNVFKETIQEIWLGENLEQYRRYLSNGLRSSCEPCKYCNINGLAFGEESFNVWKSYERPTN